MTTQNVSVAIESITVAVRSTERTDRTWLDCSAQLYKAGLTCSSIGSKAENADRELISEVKAAIVAAYSAKIQALILADTKALSEEQKKAKREAQQRIGVHYSRLCRYLAAAESEATGQQIDWKSGEVMQPKEAAENEEGKSGSKTVLAALKLPEKPNHEQLSAMAAYILNAVREAEPEFFNGKKVDIGKGCTALLSASNYLGFAAE